MKTIHGLREVADEYDVFIFDQFGVMHDGSKPYPGAVGALAGLKEHGKTVVCLSNSGKNSEANLRRLGELGFDLGHIDFFISSGEVLQRMLSSGAVRPGGITGRRARIISRGEDRSFLEGSDIEEVSDAGDAEFIILAGLPVGQEGFGFFAEELTRASKRGLPMICSNPDKIMLTGNEKTAPAAGSVADAYAEMGGQVVFVGKPFPEIYKFVREATDGRRCLAIGDSIEHDIAGATRVSINSLFIEGGIHKSRLVRASAEERDAFIRDECRRTGCGRLPDCTMSDLRF